MSSLHPEGTRKLRPYIPIVQTRGFTGVLGNRVRLPSAGQRNVLRLPTRQAARQMIDKQFCASSTSVVTWIMNS
jgi:hypothetical protein